MRLSTNELIIILVIVLLVFGARKLPDLARSLGASAKEFRKGIEEGGEDHQSAEMSDTSDSGLDAPQSDSSEVPDP